RNNILFEMLKEALLPYMNEDAKFKLIDPESARIRHSMALRNWGFHIVDNSKPQLAFQEIAGRSNPRTDFAQLLEYLERHTEIDSLPHDLPDALKDEKEE